MVLSASCPGRVLGVARFLDSLEIVIVSLFGFTERWVRPLTVYVQDDRLTLRRKTVDDSIQNFNFFGSMVLEPLGIMKRLASEEGANSTVSTVMDEVVTIVHERDE